MASHIISSHKDYQKFILLGVPRSGSNFLASSLRCRKNTITYCELFKEKSRKRRDIPWGTPGYKTTGKAFMLRDADPVAFPEAMVFNRMPTYVEALGFKLFYHYADEKWGCVWPYLKEQELKVLHLKRRNYLKVLLFIFVAMRKQEFVSGNKEKSSQLVIDLGYDECLRWFEMTKEWKTKFDSYFDGTPKVYYENLVKNYTQNMRIIQEFLNLHVGETSFPLRIRARLPLDKAIINSSNSRASSLVGNGQTVLGPKNQG